MLGQLGPGLLWATGYLLVLGVAGMLLANRRLGRRLVN